ncbi:MAG: DEAD/DEAH box helicase, partial [Euryarchaeota archaeon]|nr:DEAD/DEAH box helicase [Euryarchaeota archaeon]
MKAYSLLRKEIRTALSRQGFKRPTEVQEAAIPPILEGEDVLVIAPTGIGKTEAAILPVFHRFLEAGRREGIKVLYITPLRALNRDLLTRLEWWGRQLGIEVAVRHGDTSSYQRRKQALEPPDMLITTPETLQAILPGKVMRRHLAGVGWVVIDEIHELAEDKRGVQLSLGLERLREVAGEFQRIGLSATIGSVDEVAGFLSRDTRVVKVPASKDVELGVERPRPTREDREISEQIIAGLDAASRLRRIKELIAGHTSTLIFVNTREMAEVLAHRLRLLEAGIHHSSLSQEVRVEVEAEFKEGRLPALICTSSLELGIDVGSIDLVVQYSSPRQVTRLLQRIGRSGHRIGRKSKGLIISTDPDDILESLVISRKALAEELEGIQIPPRPYDVLAHQIVGLAMDRGRVRREDALAVVRRSWVFRDLTREEFDTVLATLSDLRLIWLEDEEYGKTRGSFRYYFENLSTIPDERRFFVRNIASRTGVGILDEAFVANYVEPGNLIIFKGRPWMVVSLDEEEIGVEPVDEVAGAIPSWVGEEIPVPFEVAMEVGRLRRRFMEEGEGALEGFPADEYTIRRGLSALKKHLRKGIPVGHDRRVVVEVFENFCVIHACFGMKVNQTLGRVFSILLSSRLGSSVTLQTDAYRIILQSPRRLEMDMVQELFETDFELVEPLLSKTLKRTSLFRWKFVHVAKRFGALSRGFTYTSLGMKKIIEAYEDTVIYQETLKELFRENLDLENTRGVMEAMKRGEMELRFLSLKSPSPLSELGLSSYAEVVLPERAERMILRALKRRIGRRRLELFCIYCTRWSASYRVNSMPERPVCPSCGAGLIAVLKGRDNRDKKKLYRRFKRGETLSPAEKREVRAMQTSANLVLSYGRDAA